MDFYTSYEGVPKQLLLRFPFKNPGLIINFFLSNFSTGYLFKFKFLYNFKKLLYLGSSFKGANFE